MIACVAFRWLSDDKRSKRRLLVLFALPVLPAFCPRSFDGPYEPFDEADIALLGAHLLPYLHADAAGLQPAMLEAYRDLRAASPFVPTPLFHSWGGLDATVHFRTPAARGGVLFLHGGGGNFVLPCAEMARAARGARLRVACPSDGVMGRWPKERIERELTLLRSSLPAGAPIFLAGLSNGAIGASAHARQLDIDGLILISGVARRHRAPRLPRRAVCTIGGSRDRMSSAPSLRRFGTRYGRHHRLPGGHFAWLHHRDEVDEILAEYFARQLRDR